MKKRIIILIPIIVILLLAIFFFVNKNKEPKITKTFDITIIVFDSNNNEVYNQKNKVMEETLLSALKTATNLTISTRINDSDEYITGINGNMAEDNYYWNYYVNNVDSSVGVADYKIKNNDIITFKLEKSN